MIVNKVKAAWSGQRSCWRLDIQFKIDGAPKRTFIVVPDAEADQSKGEAAAKRAAKEFGKGLGTLYAGFMEKHGNGAPKAAPKPKAPPSPMRRKGPIPDVSWLLDRCLEHPEIWGEVKHSKNYRSGVRKLNALVGETLVSQFEPPHGRALVVDLVERLRADDNSKGYVRKIAYQLRQALRACVGDGVTKAIVHPISGEPLLNDVPSFPPLPKSPSRTAVLEKDHDQVVFAVIRERFRIAREEERAYALKVDKPHELGIGAQGSVVVEGEVRWLNPRRFSSTQWLTFEGYIRFLLETGCRRSEALSVGNHSIREREVVNDDGTVAETYQVLHLPAEVTKTGLERFINLSPALMSAKKMWEATAKPHSFEIGDRTIARDRAWFPLTPNQVTNMWNHVRADAKRFHAVDLAKVSPHNLRHTHATRMSARGLSGKGLSDSLGHRDERTTRIYDHAQSVDQSRKFFARSVSA